MRVSNAGTEEAALLGLTTDPLFPRRASLCTGVPWISFGEHCSNVPAPGAGSARCKDGEQASAGLFASRAAPRARGGGLIHCSAFSASSFLMTSARYTSSVEFSDQYFPRVLVSQSLPSAFNEAVPASCQDLVSIVTQQPLPRQEASTPCQLVDFWLPSSFSMYMLEWRAGGQGSLLSC